jgi:hypothetical protein
VARFQASGCGRLGTKAFPARSPVLTRAVEVLRGLRLTPRPCRESSPGCGRWGSDALSQVS